MENCVFCKIASGELPAKVRYEDEDFFAFDDINPNAPIHVLLIPKRHVASVNELEEPDTELIGKMMLVAKDIAQKLGIRESGYRLVINTGPDSGQVVFHLHLHILGGKKLGPIG